MRYHRILAIFYQTTLILSMLGCIGGFLYLMQKQQSGTYVNEIIRERKERALVLHQKIDPRYVDLEQVQWEVFFMQMTLLAFAIIFFSGYFVAHFYFRLNNEIYRGQLIAKELSTAAKSKLHDVRNNYNSITYLLDQNEYEKVKQYTEKSAFYYSETPDIHENVLWTIAQEWELLEHYYNAERIVNQEVLLVNNFNRNEINNDITLFIPEVFTTLLHNSMEHGFKNKRDQCTFTVNVYPKGKLLLFEFIDNGIPGDIDEYFKDETSGLGILKQRIANKLRQARMYREIANCVVAEPSNNGTIIKLKYPYEVPA